MYLGMLIRGYGSDTCTHLLKECWPKEHKLVVRVGTNKKDIMGNVTWMLPEANEKPCHENGNRNEEEEEEGKHIDGRLELLE